jgi:hypothetical protein
MGPDHGQLTKKQDKVAGTVKRHYFQSSFSPEARNAFLYTSSPIQKPASFLNLSSSSLSDDILPSRFGPDQDAYYTGYVQYIHSSRLSRLALVQKYDIRFQFNCKSYSLGFAFMQILL